MGKKENSNIYENDQINKKHRGKSKKLEKREKHRKNKKKDKKERNEKRKVHKYIKQVFKENKKEIDMSRLFENCFDMDEIVKNVKKMLVMNPNAVTEIPDLFKMMEEGKKEVNIAGMEDKNVQKYLLKLMSHLKVPQNPKNAFSFRINNLGVKRDIKKKYTSDPNELISEFLSSYYLFVKAIFEYCNYSMNTKEKDGENDLEDENDSENDGQNSEKSEKSQEKSELKKLDKEKMEMDYEYELLEEKLGKNAELINKAFNKIMQEDSRSKDILEKQESDEELVGPPVPKFLQDTLNMLQEEEQDDTNLKSSNKTNNLKKDPFENLLKTTTYTKEKKSLPMTGPKSKIEPINKESYDRLIAYERERMKYMAEEVEDYENKFRRTSLMEDYQKKKANEKNKVNDAPCEFNRERDMNVGRVDSKRALEIMRDQKGLQGRFEAKEKYVGY